MDTKPAILIVDDEPSILQVVADILSPDYQVYKAVDTLEAAGYLTQTPLALVICDLDMPVLNGVDFISLVRKHLAPDRTPILILSAFPDLVKRVDTSLVQGVMSKPFTIAELQERVASLVRRSPPTG